MARKHNLTHDKNGKPLFRVRSNEARNKLTSIKASPTETRCIERAADLNNLTISEVMRSAIVHWIEANTPRNARLPAKNDESDTQKAAVA